MIYLRVSYFHVHENELQHQFYHPNCFAVVRAWIKVLNTVSDDQLIPALMNLVPHFPGLRKLAKITKQKVSRAQQIKRRHEWFDAFWTMKLIHHVRDTQSPSIDWEQALDEAEFIDFQSSLPLSRSAKKKVLEAQELQLLVGKEFGMSVIKKTR